jgi:transposase-like protein
MIEVRCPNCNSKMIRIKQDINDLMTKEVRYFCKNCKQVWLRDSLGNLWELKDDKTGFNPLDNLWYNFPE